MSVETPEQFFARLTTRRLSSWLLRACCSGNTAPLTFSPEPLLPGSLQQVFLNLDVFDQDRFKAAVIRAIAEWHPRGHGPNCLADLAYLAALVRATAVIDHLLVIIVNGDLDPQHDADCAALTIVIAVLMGFAPDARVFRFFEGLFFDDSFDHRFAAQLLVGLCSCRPQAFPRLISRFMLLRERHPDAYRVDFVVYELCRLVSLNTIANTLADVERRWQREFLSLLTTETWSPAFLVADRDATHIFLRTHPEQLFRLDDSLAIAASSASRQAMLKKGLRASMLEQMSPPRPEP